jgi:hypothetical protein
MNPDAKAKISPVRAAYQWLLGPPTLQPDSRTSYDQAFNQPDVDVSGNFGISDSDRPYQSPQALKLCAASLAWVIVKAMLT